MKRVILVALVVLFAFGTVAFADCAADFTAMDTNKDKSVTKEEFKAKHAKDAKADETFAAKDADKDGKLTQAEFCGKAAAPKK